MKLRFKLSNEVLRSDRHFVALYILGDQRKPRAPQDGKASQQQQQVIEQETRLARNQRLQSVFAAQVRFIFEKEKRKSDKRDQ
jgi:hypothetical protein